jgi:hypothetical protein
MKKYIIQIFGLFLFLLEKILVLAVPLIIGKYLYVFFQPEKTISIILVIIFWIIICSILFVFSILAIKSLRQNFEKINMFFYKHIDKWFDT